MEAIVMSQAKTVRPQNEDHVAHFGIGVRELETKLPGNTGFWKLFQSN